MTDYMVDNEKALKRIFLLSYEDRNALAIKIKSLGWGVISARRSDKLVSRFIGAATSIAIVDLRALPKSAWGEVKELASFVESNGFALIAAVDDDDNMIANANILGASHIIAADSKDIYWRVHLDMVLDILNRLQTVGSIHNLTERQSRTINNSWFYDRESNIFEAGTNIYDIINQCFSSQQQNHKKKIYPKTFLLRYLTPYHRRIAISAYKRLDKGDTQSAFSHNINERNYIHHMECDGKNIRGYMEEVSEFKTWRSHDILTGVRSGSFARNHLLNWNKSDDGPLSLIIIGLRQLESINTRFGRNEGNALIQQAGDRICKTLSDDPHNRFVARISGREFLIVYNHDEQLEKLESDAKNIINSLSQDYIINDEELHISARAAICQVDHNEDGISALRRANLALTEAMETQNTKYVLAKKLHNNIPFFNENLEKEMRGAIKEDQIEVVLQPQFDIQDGRLLGAEALARWNHPTLGKLGADTLFSVADRCDYRDILSSHIQDMTLKSSAQWPVALNDLRLSINVTPQQINNIEFSEKFIQMIEDNGFDPNRLTIEVTEEDLIQNIDIAVQSLSDLRKKGIKIAIDDFGTGYSSLAYITELPLDYLKLDRALIRNVLRSNKDLIVLRSIIAMAKAVGLTIIAEGVETQDTLSLLQTEKCHIYQGYYGSKPLSITQFERFALRSN